jgi:hypothetical protein
MLLITYYEIRQKENEEELFNALNETEKKVTEQQDHDRDAK